MNARTRTARRILRDRAATTRAKARIHRRGEASLTTHAVAAGLPVTAARTVANSLRNAAKRLNITGHQVRVHAGRRMRTAQRYTVAQVALLAAKYAPRKPEYRTARTLLLAA